jgi:hypothetical protein
MRKDFTFFEVLLVVAIGAVLGAVVMAALCIKRAREIEGECINNLKNTGIAFAMYQGTWVHYPNLRMGTPTGALGPGFLREGGWISADHVFSCPAEKTRPEWNGTGAYLDGLSRGFNRTTDRWHADTLGYDYDNAMPHRTDPQRAIMADKNPGRHGAGSVVLFADKHVEFLDEGPVEGEVPNAFVGDTDIYQGAPAEDTDCYLNGPDTVDH